MEPRPTNRDELTTEIRQDFEARQISLCSKLDVLLRNYGIATERLLDLYGPGLLNPDNPESAAVDRWLKFCDTLTTTEKSMVALVHVRQPNHHACHPTDLPGSSRPILSMLVVTEPQDAGLAFDREPDTRSVRIVAHGYRLKQPGPTTPVQPQFDDLTAPALPLDDTIATSLNRFNIVDNDMGDYFEIVVAGDTYGELHDAILTAYNEKHPSSGVASESIEHDPSMMRLTRADLVELHRQHATDTSNT